MGRRPSAGSIVVADGVTLKSRGGVYHYYFKVNGVQFRRSTKSSSQSEATRIALTAHNAAKLREMNGKPPATTSFSKLKSLYLRHIRSDGRYKYHSETIDRHFEPFFSDVSDVSAISRKTITSYVSYRRQKVAQPPSNLTINRELTVLRQMLKYALDLEIVKELVKIDSLPEAQHRRRRNAFSEAEYEILYKTAESRADVASRKSKKTLPDKLRILLYDYIMLISNTGLRVDETKTITWRGVDLNNGFITLNLAGKTRSSRKLVVRKHGIAALQRILARRREFLDVQGGTLSPNERVITLPDGTPVSSFKKGFNELLKACGFAYSSPSDKHTLTSLRHTFATKRLTTNRGKRATMESLAVQMGTSIRMIERHYGHAKIEDYVEELRGR